MDKVNSKCGGREGERRRRTNDKRGQTGTGIDRVTIPCGDFILDVGQDNAVPLIEGDIGIAFDERDMAIIDKKTLESTRRGVFFGGDAAWGPLNIIWAVEHGNQTAISIHRHCQGLPVGERQQEGSPP